MHSILHNHPHHVALKGALSTASSGVPAAARRWNPYNQLVTPLSSPPHLSPTSSIASHDSLPPPSMDAAKQQHSPVHQHFLPQVIRRDERTRHAGSLVDSAVQLLSEIWPQSPAPAAFADSMHTGLRPTRHGSMSSVTGALPYLKPRVDPVAAPPFQACLPGSPLSPAFIRRSNSLPSASWSTATSSQPAADVQPLSASPSSLQDATPATINPSHNQIPLKTFVYEVLRRSRTSMSILQAGLYYLEGVRSTVEELRKDEEEERIKKREVEEQQRLKTMQGDGIIDWSGSGLNDAVPMKKPEPQAVAEAAALVNTCGYFATVEKIEDDPEEKAPQPIARDVPLDPRLTPPPQFPTPPFADRLAEISPCTASADRMDCSIDSATKEDIRAKKSTLSPLLDPRRTFLASLLLASKFLQDRAYSNKAWSKLSGLDPREISRCERALGEALGWRLWVGRDNSIGTDPSFANLACFPALASTVTPSGGMASRGVRSAQSESDLAIARRRVSGPVFAGGCKRTADSPSAPIVPIGYTKGAMTASGKLPTHVVAAECRAANYTASAVAAHRRLVAIQSGGLSPAPSAPAPIPIISPSSSNHWSHTPTSSAGSSPPSSCYSATPASSYGINTPASSVVDFSFAFAMGAGAVKAEIHPSKRTASLPINGTNFPACSVGGINPMMVGAWVNEISQFRTRRTENSVTGSDFEAFYNKSVGVLPSTLENSFFASSVDEIVGTA